MKAKLPVDDWIRPPLREEGFISGVDTLCRCLWLLVPSYSLQLQGLDPEMNANAEVRQVIDTIKGGTFVFSYSGDSSFKRYEYAALRRAPASTSTAGVAFASTR